jgi:hypothetical protein
MAALGGVQVLPIVEVITFASDRAGFWARPENTKYIGVGRLPFVESYYGSVVPTKGQVWPRNS